MAITYRSGLGTSGEVQIDSLTVTTMPTTTAYMQGDTLDTTGLVITATAGSLSGVVTNDCTISPTTLSTVGTQAITVTYYGATTSFNVTVEAITGISVTTPPTTTTYNVNDTLDLTGIVVTAASANLTRDITSSCTFSPADGSMLDTAGTITITASWQTFTATTTVTVTAAPSAVIYGAEWDGSSSSAWTRTDAAANFADPQPAVSNGNGSSPFDNIMPWSGMAVVSDSAAGRLVSIPKYYYKWTRDGAKMKLQISENEFDGSLVSPAHADRGDGAGERSVVYVGAYACASQSSSAPYTSKYNVNLLNGMSRKNFRNNIHNLGSTIWQWDFAMYWTIMMLYLVEYADWNSQAKIGYGCGNGSSIEKTGFTQSMIYHTGTNAADRTTYGHTRYRYIEDLWGNVYNFIDGIRFDSSDKMYCYSRPSDFSETSGGTLVGYRIMGSGVISSWSNPNVNGFEYCLFPSMVSGTTSDYVCDYYVGLSGTALQVGGNYSQSQNHGAFYMKTMTGEYGDSTVGSRLMKLP